MFHRICPLLILLLPNLLAAQAKAPGSTDERLFMTVAITALQLEFSAPPGFPQEAPQSSPALPNAAALVRKSLKATGELDLFESIGARTLTGTIQLPNTEEPGQLRVVQARPNLFLESSNIPGLGEVRIGGDGQTVWMDHPVLGAQVLEGALAAQESLRNAFDFALHTRKHIRSMETVARLSFDGRDCYQVHCEMVPFIYKGKILDPVSTERYRLFNEYYEVESGLLAGIEAFQATPVGDQASTTFFRNYSELVEGILVATQLVSRFGDQEIVTTFASLSFDPVDKQLFAPPAALTAAGQQKVKPAPGKGDSPGEGEGTGE